MATGSETGWPREIELKLDLAPRDHAALSAHPAVRRRLVGRFRHRRLTDRYFDTPDRDLRARGAALRIRHDGTGFEQTLKLARAPNDVHADRIEWSCPVEDFVPRPQRLPPELAARAGLGPDTVLEPLFETRVRRRTALLRWRRTIGGTVELELALDRGLILAAGERSSFSELELELRRGPPAALYALAQTLARTVPLRLSTADEAVRGHLLTGAPPPPFRAVPPTLDPTMSTAAAFRRTAASVLAHWLASETAIRHGRDIEAVHQLRVALRRGLVALRLFRTVLPAGDRERLRDGIRGVLDGLAEMRELDVARAEFLDPLPVAEAEGLSLLIDLLERRRRRRRAEVTARLDSRDHAGFVLEFASWVEREGWRETADTALLLRQELPIADHAARELNRSWKRVARGCRRLDRLGVAERHELRLATKRMRYAVDFFVPLHPAGRTEAWRRRLRRFQDLLGEDADLASLHRLLAGLLAEGPRRDRDRLAAAAGFVLGWHRHRLASLPRRLEKEAGRLGRLRPFW